MPCDTRLLEGQTIQQRAAEVRATVEAASRGLATGKVKAKVGPQGAIAFDGLSNAERNRATDACIYRRVMASGSALAKMAIAKAEQLAGVSVNRQTVASGVHSHDGGKTWHGH